MLIFLFRNIRGTLPIKKTILDYTFSAVYYTKPKLLHTSTGSLGNLRWKGRAMLLKALKERVDYMTEKGLWPENRRWDFLEWNYDAEIYAFAKRLGEEFDDAVLKEALIDQCYVVEQKEKLSTLGVKDGFLLKSNLELSEIGRALAKDFLTRHLRGIWPLLPEEGIECIVQYLTSDEILGKVGNDIGLKDLILSKEYPPNIGTFANSFAAIVASLNLSSGAEKTYKFIQDFVISQLVGKDIWDIWHLDDPLYTLKSILNANGKGDPEPRVIGDIGKNTIEATFYIGIYSDKEFVGAGYGETTETGIHVAALDSLSRIFNQTLTRDPIPINQDVSNFNLKSSSNQSLNEYIITNT